MHSCKAPVFSSSRTGQRRLTRVKQRKAEANQSDASKEDRKIPGVLRVTERTTIKRKSSQKKNRIGEPPASEKEIPIKAPRPGEERTKQRQGLASLGVGAGSLNSRAEPAFSRKQLTTRHLLLHPLHVVPDTERPSHPSQAGLQAAKAALPGEKQECPPGAVTYLPAHNTRRRHVSCACLWWRSSASRVSQTHNNIRQN